MYCTKCGHKLGDECKFCSACGNHLNSTSASVKKEEHPHQEHAQQSKKTSNKNRKIGLWLLIAPGFGLVFIFAAWAIASFVIGGLEVASSDSPEALSSVANIINIVLGFLGIIAVVGIIVGIPLGIAYLMRSDSIDTSGPCDPRSGKGVYSEIPEEIRGWNWGAAGLSWIWGAYFRVWISFLMFVPILNWIWWIVMGIKGNEWAWSKTKWRSVEQFNKAQDKWKVWGIIFIFLPFALIFLSAIFGG